MRIADGRISIIAHSLDLSLRFVFGWFGWANRAAAMLLVLVQQFDLELGQLIFQVEPVESGLHFLLEFTLAHLAVVPPALADNAGPGDTRRVLALQFRLP